MLSDDRNKKPEFPIYLIENCIICLRYNVLDPFIDQFDDPNRRITYRNRDKMEFIRGTRDTTETTTKTKFYRQISSGLKFLTVAPLFLFDYFTDRQDFRSDVILQEL